MSTELTLKKIDRNQDLPLSTDQYRIWFLHQLNTDLIHFNINFAFQIQGLLDTDVFVDSLNAIVNRHESLRTTFVVKNDNPVQHIRSTLTLDVPIFDLTSLPLDEANVETRQRMNTSGKKIFSLSEGPMLRVEIYRLTNDEYRILFTIHHIVADFDSLKLIMKELFHFFRERVIGSAEALPELSIQYVDYAHWQNERMKGGEYTKQLNYWKQQLSGEIPVLKMPMDRPRKTIMTNNGATYRINFSKALTDKLQFLSKKSSVTLFVTLYSAYQVLLQRYTGQDEINIGTPITTRNRPELANLVGLFINTLVLKSDLKGDPSFSELLKRNRKIAFSAFARQEIPYEKLVDELKPQRNLSHNLFFQTMVMFLEAEEYDDTIVSGLFMKPFEIDKQTTTFELTLTFSIVNGCISLLLDYNLDLYNEATVVKFLEHFKVLLHSIVENPEQSISALHIMAPEEELMILQNYCSGSTDFTDLDLSICDRFEQRVAKTPNATAVRFRDQKLTYFQLNTKANQLAHWLIKQGIEKGQFVGLLAERSLDMMVAILGILKAGAAYIPIDPKYPVDRIQYILDDCKALMVLSTTSSIPETLNQSEAIVSLSSLWSDIAEESTASPGVTITPDDLMYLIYTSGSTGQPKGVLVTHKNVSNHCNNMIKRFHLTSEDGVLQFTSISFDVSIQEIFPTLLIGATLVLWKDSYIEESSAFLEWMRQEKVTVLNLTTAHWNNIVSDLKHGHAQSPDHLKLVIVGGEKVSRETYEAWDAATAGRIRWINDYGLTETTVTATMFEPKKDWKISSVISVGTPLDNVSVYILDSRKNLLPLGVFGDLYVGGIGVAQGYLNLPDLTEERFVDNPFSIGKLFKTGDVARIRRDGEIEFEGREDQQVKIRGHRVELGEVESKINQFSSVAKSVVLARKSSNGSNILYAYIVTKDEHFKIANLKSSLKGVLPDYMVPTEFVSINDIPLTVNGKVDRDKLPTPKITVAVTEYVDPSTEYEQVVADIWTDVLGISKVSMLDAFFDIGGDSLLATQVIARLKHHFQFSLPLKLLFEYPVLNEFALLIQGIVSGERSSTDKCVVKIQQKGTKTPIFYVHPVGGSVTCYFTLSNHLGPDQPFYALQSHAMIDPDSPLETIEEMAKYYLSEIQEIQPHGPYRLGGWSMGGFIAYEMTKLLQTQGEDVIELSMIDTYLTKTRVSDYQSILFNFILQLAAVPGRSISTTMLNTWKGKEFTHAEMCQELRGYNLIPQSTSDAEVQHLLDVYMKTVYAFKKYDPRPEKKLNIPRTVLFRATDSHEELGVWSSLINDVKVYHVGADHFGIVHNKKVGEILSS